MNQTHAINPAPQPAPLASPALLRGHRFTFEFRYSDDTGTERRKRYTSLGWNRAQAHSRAVAAFRRDVGFLRHHAAI